MCLCVLCVRGVARDWSREAVCVGGRRQGCREGRTSMGAKPTGAKAGSIRGVRHEDGSARKEPELKSHKLEKPKRGGRVECVHEVAGGIALLS